MHFLEVIQFFKAIFWRTKRTMFLGGFEQPWKHKAKLQRDIDKTRKMLEKEEKLALFFKKSLQKIFNNCFRMRDLLRYLILDLTFTVCCNKLKSE